MHDFLRSIPNTAELNEIYRHSEAQPLDPDADAPLVFLKQSLQNAITLFRAKFLPISDQNERDLCADVWYPIRRAFDNSILKIRMEKSSNACKEMMSRKRKMPGSDRMNKQSSPLIPDMTISHVKQEYAIIEAAKTKNDTKQINDGGRKCPELMLHIFDQLLTTCPNEQHRIKVYGCLLSELDCTPLELSCSKGYVKIFKRGKIIKHPESPLHFKPRMTELLAYLWKFRLAIEAVCLSMAQAESQQSSFT